MLRRSSPPARGPAAAILTFTACAALGAPAGIHAAVSPGVIPGTFQVDPNGGANYVIEIEVPPGIERVQPDLELIYDSQAGNGPLGMGWMLQGLDRIERTPAILAVDGYAGGVNYDPRDRFALTGKRLIDVDDGSGKAYHTELESWNRVVASGSAPTGPDSFSARNRSGWTLEFGTTPDSRIVAYGQSFARVWALAAMRDLNGNTVSFRYAQSSVPDVRGGTIESPGQFYPLEIAYTANGSAAANRFVRFAWEPRPDVTTQYVGGYPVTTAARLASITTYVGQTAVRRYVFSYETAPATGRSRLVEIRLDAGDLVSSLTPTHFTPYQDLQARFQPKQKVLAGAFGSDDGWTSPDQYPRQMGDVNGDGRLDAVGFKVMTSQGQTGGVQVALAGAAGFTLTPPWNSGFASGTAGYTTQTSTPRFLADVNGDGMADVIGFSTAGVQTGLSTGTSFDATKWPVLDAFKSPVWNPLYDVRTLGDVNGDGAADLIGFKGGVQVALAGPNGFSAPATWASGFSHDQNGPDGAVWDQYTPRVMADVNGDRRADVVGFGKDKVYVALSDGAGGFGTAGWDNNYPYFGYSGGGYNPRYYPRLMADVNGDGMMDIVGFKGGIQVGLSTGKGFLPPQKWFDGMSYDTGWTLEMPRITADVNGDGMADVVGFNAQSQGNVEVLLSTGSLAAGGFAAGRWTTLAGFGSGWTAAQNPQLIADVTGDGLSDVVGFGKDGIYAANGAGQVPDLLARITDGLGGRVELVYANLSDPNVYRQTGGALAAAGSGPDKVVSALAYSTNPLPADTTIPVFAPQRLQGGRFNVVAAHTLTNDAALNRASYSYSHAYRYTNAAYDLSGRGWLGFETTTDRDAALGLESQSSFLQAFPFTERMRQLDVACGERSSDPSCAPGKKIGTHRLDYLCEPGTSCNADEQAVFQPYPKVYQVLASREQTDKYEYGVYGFSLGKTFGYDRYGNRTLDAYLGYVDRATGRDLSADDGVYTYSLYDNDASPGRWHVGYELASRVTAKPDGGRLAAVSCASQPAYDPASDFSLKSTRYSDDGRLLPLAHCVWDGGRSAWSTTGYGDYDRFGHARAETDPAGHVTNTEYETAYNTYPSRILQPANDQGVRLGEWYGFDPRFGLQVAKTDFNDVPRFLVVDPFGRVVAKQGPVPQITGATVKPSSNQVSPFVTGTFGFARQSVVTLATKTLKSDGAGGLYYHTEMAQKWPVADAPASAPFQDWVDGLDRTYRRVAAAQCDGQGAVTVDVENDARNQITRESLPYYPEATVRWQTTVYDAYGRPRQQQQPAGDGSQTATTRFSYALDSQGEIVTETRVAAPESASYVRKLTYRYYQSKQQLTRMDVVSAGGAATQYTYDRLGRQLSAVDPAGQTTAQTYDSMGRQATLTAPGLGQVVLAYGANGEKSSETDGYGVTRYGYDPLDRLTSVERPDGSTVAVRWDKPGTPYALGHPYLSSVTQGAAQASRYEYAYDVYGQPAAVTLAVAGVADTFTTGLEHDPLERVIRYTYPDGGAEVRDYDLCHLRSVSLDGATYATFYTWSAGGQPEKVVYGNGANTILRTYSPTGQVLHHRVDDSRGTALLSQKLTWDLLGQIAAVDDELGGTYSQRFTYDNLRLASAAGAYGAIAYGYDGAGNLKRQGPVSFEYDGEQVKRGTDGGRQVFSASYGTMGRTDQMEVEGVAWNFGYDSRNRVVQARRGDGAVERYVYGPDGARVMATAPDGTKTVYVLGAYRVKYPASGPPQRTKFVSSPGGIIAAVVAGATPAPKIYYFHHNVVFTTLLITAADGSKLAAPVFSPYGSPVRDDSVDGVEARYADRPIDSFTRLYLFAARSYNPFTGRFLTPDSQLSGDIDRQDALNRYAYAFNDPILIFDPTGHSNTVGDVIMFLIDAAEIAGGVAIIVASGGTLTPLGAALIGAGVSGAIYNAMHINQATPEGFVLAQAVGFVTGLISGGVGAAGGAATSSAVSAAESAGWSAGRQLAITIGGRVLTGATAGALGSVGGQVTGNLLTGKQPFANFSGWAVLESAGVGAVGGLLSAGLGRVGQAAFRNTEEDAFASATRFGVFTEESQVVQVGTVSRTFLGWSSLLMPFSFNTNKVVIAVAQPQW